MPREARIVPDEGVLLCEGCGYVISGLPIDGNCPECGKPIAQSVGTYRQMTEYERQPGVSSFWQTTFRLIRQPTRFYQTLQTRAATPTAERFASLHRLFAAVLFATAAVGHFDTIREPTIQTPSDPSRLWLDIGFWFSLCVLLFVLLSGINRLATWLSVIESRYWGMRLPQPVVRRGMAFHAADYLPVSVTAVAIVWGYRLLMALISDAHRFDLYYLYGLSGFVIIAAGYLFTTYWMGMRNMVWANR